MIPLADQRAKLDRLLEERLKWYRLAVRKGTMTAEVGVEKVAEVEAIRASFRFLVDNADWIRDEARKRQIRARQEADLRALENEPAVAAVKAAFPESEITRVTRLEPAE